MTTAFQEYNDVFEAQLRDPAVISATVVKALDTAEEKTGAKRVHIIYGLGGVLALYLILGSMAGLVCNIVGFAYPCYMSFKAISSAEKDDDTQWLTYWCVFGFFSLIDTFADPIMSVMPLYWLAKCVFMVYLYHPVIMGAKNVYVKVVAPAMVKLEAALAGAEAKKEE